MVGKTVRITLTYETSSIVLNLTKPFIKYIKQQYSCIEKDKNLFVFSSQKDLYQCIDKVDKPN